MLTINNLNTNITEYKKQKKGAVYAMTLWCNIKMKLGEVCNMEIGGTPRRNVPEYFGGNNIWISVSELNNNYIYDSKEKITNLGVQKSNVKLVKKDSILMSFKMSLGKKAIAGTDLYTNEAIVAINSKNPNTILNKYIYYYIDNFDFSDACSTIGTEGNMNKSKLANLDILIPTLEEQQEIIQVCEYYDDIINKAKEQIDFMNKLQKNIINKVLVSNNVNQTEEDEHKECEEYEEEETNNVVVI